MLFIYLTKVYFPVQMRTTVFIPSACLARPAGFEPAALGLEVRCSIQLSYERMLVGPVGLEPTTNRL